MNRGLILTENFSKSCRICLDNDNPNDLIRPCLCSGGSAYVHRKCLDNWRSLNENGRAFKFCDVCKFEYVIEPVIDDPSADNKRLLMFRFLVTRDITLIILLIQLIIIGMTFLLQAADKKNHDIKNLYPSSANAFGIYYLSSLILFFAVLGLFGLIGACCGLITNNDNDGCNCTSYQCFFLGTTCNGCDGNNCNGGGGDGGGVVILFLVIIFIFAIIGVFVGIILGGIIITQIMTRHKNKLWLRQETKKYVVEDFQGKIDELRNISNQRPITNSSIHNQIENDAPSAPVQITNEYAKYTTS
jgi:hypothetical protein